MFKLCVLYEGRFCNKCGECNCCDLDPTKVCNSCCKCLNYNSDYKILEIEKIIIDKDY
jgi:hypothetical protein